MNIFIAGGSGAIGRQLVPMLVQQGHGVVAMTRTPEGAARLEAMGVTAVIGDVFDAARLNELARQAAPDLLIHQRTAVGVTEAEPLAETIRVRTEGTRNLVAATQQAGARRLITEAFSSSASPSPAG